MKNIAKKIKAKAEGRAIILYGASYMAEALYRMLKTVDCTPQFMVDRNYRAFGKLICEVRPPDDLDAAKHFPIIVPFGKEAIASIKKKCLKRGYKAHDLFIWHYEVDEAFQYNHISIGKGVQLSKALTRYDASKYIESVGNYSSISHSFSYGRDHVFGISTSALVGALISEEAVADKKLVIGNDVWIGANTFINCSKVKQIGDGAVIAAGAMVMENVPSYAIVAGVPAKVIGYRFDEQQIEILKKVRWWEWQVEKIQNKETLFKDQGKFFKEFL